jgi:transposase
VARNTDVVRDLVGKRVAATKAKITAKRLLAEARAAGYEGSVRNFRRLVATEKKVWRTGSGRQRRPAVWVPGETLVIDWGAIPGTGLRVFCAVLAWCRVRFVRFAREETAATTFGMLAECFEALGGVPTKVLADRMGCLKGGTVAGVVIPTPDYVRFAP